MVQTFLEYYRPAGLSHGPPRPLRSPMEPHMGPKRAHMRAKPKIVRFGPTIKCHTIFQLKISPEIQWAYAYTYTRPPCHHMGPQGAHMGPKHLK